MSDSAPAPEPKNESGAEAPQELPNTVSYGVIAAVVIGLGAYAWWSSTQEVPTHVQWNANGDVVAVQDAITEIGVDWIMQPATVKLADIILPGIPRDGIPALVSPKAIPIADAKYDDRLRVVGVSIEGTHRAYPVNLLLHHEVINDELAGAPIAVTLSPPSETFKVYDRRVDGETIELGVAGRVYFSNSLLFDRRESQKDETLWSQYTGEAIAGPAATGKKLEVLDSMVTSMARWKKLHPDSTVISEDTGHQRDYSINPHASSYGSDSSFFPLPKPTGRRTDVKPKSEVVIVSTSGGRKGYFLDDLRARKGSMIEDSIGGQPVKIGYPQKALEVEGPEDLVRFQSHWLAVDAFEPELDLWSPDDGEAPAVTGATAPTGAEAPADAPAATGEDVPSGEPAPSE